MYHELHLHTCYSFLDGASQPEEIARRAAELGYTVLAVTDHDGLYGAMAFALACQAVGIRPITGVELTLRHGLLERDDGPVHLTLLAEDRRGYANICRLITAAHHASPKYIDRAPGESVALDPARLAAHAEGVIALSGCRQGEAARLVDAGRDADAAASLGRLAEIFGRDNTFVELQHNRVRGDTRRVARLATLADEIGLPVVATGDVHYHDRDRHRLQDTLVAIRHRATLEFSHRVRRPNSEFALRHPDEVAALFAAYPAALANTLAIGERCAAFNLAASRRLGYEFPDFTRQEGEGDSSADDTLAHYCAQRFAERYGADAEPAIREKARAQLAEELALIARHRLSGFFLIYRDLQELATRVAVEVRGAGTIRGGSGLPPGRGRGSSVSSIVCYLIGLSHVDPVRHRLFFRRFLNEDLRTVPDIDLDFARDIREKLILAVYERYGHDHAALVCTYATYHLRSAIRDVGKALGLPLPTLEKLAKIADGHDAAAVRRELATLPDFAARAQGPLWGQLADLAEQIAGLPRHVGQHVGGMIISSQPIAELVPVQPAAMEGRYICQWDKDACDDARFVKIDFLALGMLSLVEECLEMIWQNHGKKVDLGALGYDDPALYDRICAGDTVGLFQIESRAQIQMLPRTQPRTLDDLAVEVAIVRPGPIVGGAVNPYVRRREALRKDPSYPIKADHPLLDGILRDTLGVILYQDQVLEVATTLANFTAGQADQFRRAMSRRRSQELMESFRAQFIAGAAQNDVPADQADAIFEKLAGFSAFGFPKSHAYAFAVLAYQSAWLRHYYPAEFYAALFNNQPMGFYPPHVLVGDARRHGRHILRVAVNRSGVGALPLERGILLGLAQVQGVGKELARRIVAAREAGGPYRSLGDLVRRVPMPRSAAANLIVVGALGDLGLGRRELLWQLGLLHPQPLALAPAPTPPSTNGTQNIADKSPLPGGGEVAGWLGEPGTRAGTREAGGGGGEGHPASTAPTRRPLRVPLGRQLALPLPTAQDMVELPDMTDWERMVADYGLLGLSPAYHPFGLMRRRLPPTILTAARVHRSRDGRRVRTAGLVVCRQRPQTAKGFVFLLLEDETGITNVVVRPALYEAHRGLIRANPYLCVEGIVQVRSGSFNLIATDVTALLDVPARLLPPAHIPAAVPPPDLAPPDARPADVATPIRPADLLLATPASHDFH